MIAPTNTYFSFTFFVASTLKKKPLTSSKGLNCCCRPYSYVLFKTTSAINTLPGHIVQIEQDQSCFNFPVHCSLNY